MAQVPYSQGVPSVEPQVSVPDNYLRIPSTPAEFGGLVGQGEQALGQGALKAHQFYGEVAADNATNQYMEGARKIIYGDPDKPWLDATGNPILDNDGKPQPDRGLIGLQGDQAMRAGPQKIKELDDLRKRLGAGLLTGDSQLKFDAETRRMQSYHNTQIGAHIENEAQKWAGEVEKARVYNHKIALGQAVLAGDQPEIDRHTQDIIGAHVAQASRLGGGNELMNQAVNLGKAEAAETAIEALMPTDPKKARDLLTANRSVLAGVGKYDALDARTKAHAFKSEVDGLVAGALAAPSGPRPIGPVKPEQFTAEASRQGIDPALVHATAAIESDYGRNTGNRVSPSNTGIFQRAPAGAPGGMNDTYENQIRLGVGDLVAERDGLRASLGREPTNAETYLAHQQGVSGATKLINNPNTPAGQLVPPINISNNGGNPNALASQFVGNWQQRYEHIASRFGDIAQGTAGAQPAQVPGAPPVAAPIPSGVPDAATVPLPHSEGLAAALDHIQQSDASPEAKELASQRVERRYRALEADDSRYEAAVARKTKQVSEAAENEYIAADSKLTAAQASVDARLTPEAKMRMIGYINRADKPDPLTRVSQQTTTHILEDMRRDPGDPKRIEDTGPIYDAFIHSQLNRADFDFLTKQFADTRSPQGEKLMAREKEFMAGIKPTITKSNALMGAGDPTGDPSFYMYQWTVDQKIDQYRKEGKDPFDLFNPKNPDYVGSPDFVRPFQTTFQQSLKAKTELQQHIPPSYPAPAVIPRLPGETPADYLKRIGSPVSPSAAAAPPPAVPPPPAAPTITPPIR